VLKRFSVKTAAQSFIIPAVLYTSAASAIGFAFWPYFYYVKNGVLIAVAFVGFWRYTMTVVNWIRALIYGFWVYPRLRARGEALPYAERFPKHIYFIIPSYKEEPWVSVEVFQSLYADLETLPVRATLIVSTATDEEDALMHALHDAYADSAQVEVVLQRQSQGKRIAMGHALRAAARHYYKREPDPNSITILMDGDTYLPLGTLEKCMPIFAVEPELGAVTTNEIAYINTRSKWYRDWFNLKFGQRHVLFQSQSLSKRVLTLTGRFSVFRTSIVLSEPFIRQIEHDTMVDPYYGKFRFLMGDDKSSWYYLMKNGWQMRYLPDVLVYSLESRDGDFLALSRSLPYRWYGNTLRNNARARKIKKIPLFIRYLLIDQVVLMWTALVGIVGAIYLSIFVNFVYLPLYIAWVLLVRVLMMGVIALSGHPVSVRTIPLMLHSQWVGALTKIRAYYHLSDQKWSKGGTEVQKADGDVVPLEHPLAKHISKIRMYFAVALFLFAMLLSNTHFMRVPDPDIFSGTVAQGGGGTPIDARAFGVRADDGKDDAAALNRLIAEAAPHSVIYLPKGTLDLDEPLQIRRSHLSIIGNHTRLLSHLHAKEKAAILIEGHLGRTVGVTTEALYGKRRFGVTFSHPLHGGALLLIEQPNDKYYVQKVLGSQRWYRRYPTIRSEIVQATNIMPDAVETAYPVYTPLQQGATVKRIDAVTDVNLSGFTLQGDRKTEAYRFTYENVDPQREVNGIMLRYTAFCNLQDIRILDSGSSPLVFEHSYADRAENIFIEGALNKGKKGNGYLRINKSFRLRLKTIEVRYLRHIAIQWASAYNHLSHIRAIQTDVNFHGGGSHHNRVDDIVFDVDDTRHKWGEVYRTPPDASWAPPDGPENIVQRR
jgi:glycosyltransferase Alg8